MASFEQEQKQEPARGGPVEGLHFTRREYKVGEVVFEEGDTVEAYYLVEWGKVSITQDAEHIVDGTTGAHFEHLTTRASETVCAVKDTEIIIVDKQQFDQYVCPMLLGGASIRHHDVADVLAELLLVAVHANPKVRAVVSFTSQLGIVSVFVIGLAVLGVNLAMDGGWKPWQTCNDCDPNAPEPTQLLWVLNGLTLGLLAGSATLAKVYFDH